MFYSIYIKLLSAIMSIVIFFTLLFNPGGYREGKQDIIDRAGGFICGICHPNEDYDTLKDANIGWVRFDIPFPYSADGTRLSHFYTEFKERARGYAENGMKVMAVTPYPREYVEKGIDPRTPEGEARVREIAVFLINDLRDIIGGLQITNEMQGASFKYPLTEEEGARFTGIQLEELYPIRGNIIIGYNTANSALEYHKMMKPYLPYCDYVGLDIYYVNTGANGAKKYQQKVLDVFKIVKKPIIMQEFGYFSNAELRDDEKRAEKLRSYGYKSEAEAIADSVNFTSKLPQAFQITLSRESDNPEEWAQILFDRYSTHFYCDIGQGNKHDYLHNEEGQASFFATVISALAAVDCVAGIIIYCNCDQAVCWCCGQPECPYETGWGICRLDGTPKAAYYSVQKAFGDIVNK